MASLYSNNCKISIKIISYEINNKVAHYNIEVQVGETVWTLCHRYNDFVELNEKLVKDHSLVKDLLPPKKLLHNLEPTFLEKRKSDLEVYLQTTVNFLEKSLPRCLIEFLCLDKYDINILLQDFSVFCYREGDNYLTNGNLTHGFNPLQLYAITKRLKQECPIEEAIHQEHDFCNILEFCTKLHNLIIKGSSSNIGTSNVSYNELAFDLTMFKALKKLYLYNVDIKKITSLGPLRNELVELLCQSSSIESPSALLLCDQVHRTVSPHLSWPQLTHLDLSRNQIKHLDDSLTLVPNLEELFLESNQIETIANLKSLTRLKRLNLSRNMISDLAAFSSELHCESVHDLDLSENRITDLTGLESLINLQSLDLGSNFVGNVAEILSLKSLEHLTNINLTGNPIATIIDYRIKILQLFIKRADMIVLDNEKPTSKEIDCTNILNALLLS